MAEVADAIDRLDDAELPSQASGEASQEVAAEEIRSTAGLGSSKADEDQSGVDS